MLLGPASCAEPQTPPATPAAERPRRPAPPVRPVIFANGLASADGVTPDAALWELPAAGTAGSAVPATEPGTWLAGACPAGEEPPVPADDPDHPPDGDGVPEGCSSEGAGASGKADGLAGREGDAVSEDVGAGDGAGSV